MITKTRLPNGKIQVVFSVTPQKAAKSVFLVGDFNNWNSTATPMQCQDLTLDGTWKVTLEPEPGRIYQFRYLVDTVKWINDDTSDGQANNTYGGVNSILNLESNYLPVVIQHPYTNTPYDLLSDAEVGVISPSTPQGQIQQQRREIVRRKKLDARTAAEMIDRLAGFKRLEVDVFLCCTFDMKQDLDQALNRYSSPRIPEAGAVKFSDGLPYWLEISLPPVTLDELTITHSSVYDDPGLDLQTVDFDS